MATYDDAFRAEMAELRDEILTDLGADGLVLAQEVPVSLVYEATAGANPYRGSKGTITHTLLRLEPPLVPRPSVTQRQAFALVAGVFVKRGETVLTMSRSITREQLEGAAFAVLGDVELVDGQAQGGERYDLNKGELKRKGLSWVVTLTRRQAQVSR